MTSERPPPPVTRTEGEGETRDLPEGMLPLAPGQMLGTRYQILKLLGRGGMGEVWHAVDLKLGVEVALKALRSDLFESEGRLEILRQEVRAAREVISPNVCRIFDLIEIDGRELLSMEYVDGTTLLEVLHERGPLDLKEAQTIASQFLGGLEAIHDAGLIHRDIKPENIMITRTGRVVVMDFGLARQEAEGSGSVSGTPAYMAPEQAAGQELDTRVDIYASGVVLAEMVSPDGIKDFDSRQSLWEGVRSEPAKVPDTPWSPVIRRAVAKDREGRYDSAHTLTRALEDVTLRVETSEDLRPYPGLVAFTEDDAQYFFGREAEVERMWRKLEGPPRLFALVGPSGAGKSSFLRAGLISTRGSDWVSVIATPGASPVKALASALVEQLSGDAWAMQRMLDFDDPDVAVEVVTRWRRRRDHALLIIDQFEELFTQNPAEVQRHFADMLSRFVLDADVHVLLSMRDDFFFHCHQYPSLAPLQNNVTLIGPPVGSALRSALVQPATACGYRFEDDELVDQMLEEIEGERGALPLLAFAAARLWEKRDRDAGLLTREAYLDIGGVGGALARHAEATIERIGTEQIPIIREIFRNLVTAEGTRAIREWDELLSVFDESERESAEVVLRELIDGRLLTSYEVSEEDLGPIRRVEIIHESLLANWPRLVRWQTQDADAAQMRDELRQSARSWDEHGRPTDRLWTGSTYREFTVWYERYPGGLSETEEAFASAMSAFAGKRRRRRRMAVTAVMVAGALTTAVITVLWLQSVREGRRAEAAALLAQAQLELQTYPTAAVAYALASLEKVDTTTARRLALEALWKGPTAFVVNEDPTWRPDFMPDGRWLLQGIEYTGQLRIIGIDGTSELLEKIDDEATKRLGIRTASQSDVFLTYGVGGEERRIGLWSAPERRLLAQHLYESVRGLTSVMVSSSQQRALLLILENGKFNIDVLTFDGEYKRLGTVDLDSEQDGARSVDAAIDLPDSVDVNRQIVFAFDRPEGRSIWASTGHTIFEIGIGETGLSEPRFFGKQESAIRRIANDRAGRFLATLDVDGQILIWSLDGSFPPKTLPIPSGAQSPKFVSLGFTDDGSAVAYSRPEAGPVRWIWSLAGDEPRLLRRLEVGEKGEAYSASNFATTRRFARTGPDAKTRIWSYRAPFDVEPLILQHGSGDQGSQTRFEPAGRWLATAGKGGLRMWPMVRPYPMVIQKHKATIYGLTFGPDGRWLASSAWDNTVRLWPLDGDVPPPGRVLFELPPEKCCKLCELAVSPDGRQFLVGTESGGVWHFSMQGQESVRMPGFESGTPGVAFSPDGTFAAAIGGNYDATEAVIRVWDVPTWEEMAVLTPPTPPFQWPLQATEGGHIFSAGNSGLLRWSLAAGTNELVYEGAMGPFAATTDGRRVLAVEKNDSNDPEGSPVFLDFDTGDVTRLTSHGDRVIAVALDSTGTVAVSGDQVGEVRVGPVTGEEPHLLLGHEGPIYAIAVDPLGRWIASAGQDKTIRLWPMPDFSKPPLHTLPREELIAKLETLTNLRVVRDEESSTGWKLTHDPFPGWAEVPTW